MEILSAEWLVPMAMPVICDGSLVIADGRITEIGKRTEILGRHPGVDEFRYPAVLMPGLVNGHMHLELSGLRGIDPPPADGTFTDWISELLGKRESEAAGRPEIIADFTAVLRRHYASGVALVADTGNEFFAELVDRRSDDRPEILRILEYLAPNRQALLAAREKIANLDDRYVAGGHAPYSTSPELLVDLKRRCRRLGQIFSIHTAESSAELEFLRAGTGCFHDFLEQRKAWDGIFTFAEKGFSGTIAYFEYLGILDDKTLLVHAVHVSEEELQLIAMRGAHVCLCPGSNRFLRVGRAPVEKMMAAGILPALGTDSPASNESIDLWREMQVLAADNPRLPYQSILAMATVGGAQALHRGDDYGSLLPGKKSQILHVSSPALRRCRDSHLLVQELVMGGKPEEISWVAVDH
jgi:cytosine/adenosine deaminase-related metal-dependent hydrolase